MERSLFALALLAAVGCGNDYKVGSGLDTVQPMTTTATPAGDDDDDDDHLTTTATDPGGDWGDDDDDGSGDDDDDDLGDDDDDDDGWGDGDDDDDDDVPHRDQDIPPAEWEPDDCAEGVRATWMSGELVVLGGDGPQVGVIDVPVAGVYDVYDRAAAESGGSQTNESAYLRVPSATDPAGLPSPLGLLNCLDDYVALDPDNVAPPAPGMLQYFGTFAFEAGQNDVELHHYCSHYRNGDCQNLHDGGTPCDGVNSVHFLGEGLCLVEVK